MLRRKILWKLNADENNRKWIMCRKWLVNVYPFVIFKVIHTISNIFGWFSAQLCFLPSGLFMGYIFYVFEFAASNKLENITYFPYIIGFSAAFLIALLYSAFKSNKRQELYQQFHILIGSSVLYIIGGGLFMLQIGEYCEKYFK